MGLMTNLLTWPLAPVRATVALAEQIRRQAEAEYYDCLLYTSDAADEL